MENIKISFNPKQKNLDDISKWMVEEKKIPIEINGNWKSILSAYNEKRLVIAIYKSKTVGFFIISKTELLIYIDIAEINPNFRKRGIAYQMLNEIIKKHEKNETYALHLFCAPESSHKIWNKLGFKYFPNNSEKNLYEKIKMYKLIKPILKPKLNKYELEKEVIEIWNDEPYKTKDNNPNWTWYIIYIKNTKILKTPIVHFGDYEWRIRWRKGNEIIKDCKYKNFDRKNTEFNCMIIKETPNIK
jgi:hypothetical protein